MSPKSSSKDLTQVSHTEGESRSEHIQMQIKKNELIHPAMSGLSEGEPWGEKAQSFCHQQIVLKVSGDLPLLKLVS